MTALEAGLHQPDGTEPLACEWCGSAWPCRPVRDAAIAAAQADPEIQAMAIRGAGLFHALPTIIDVVLRNAAEGKQQKGRGA